MFKKFPYFKKKKTFKYPFQNTGNLCDIINQKRHLISCT